MRASPDRPPGPPPPARILPVDPPPPATVQRDDCDPFCMAPFGSHHDRCPAVAELAAATDDDQLEEECPTCHGANYVEVASAVTTVAIVPCPDCQPPDHPEETH